MDTVATKRDPFSVEEQAADLRRHARERGDVAFLAAGAINAYAREGGAFDDVSPIKRLEYIRNALAAAELVRAEMWAALR